jgi:hypothetical protein
LYPAAFRPCEIAAPMPRVPPVTNATRAISCFLRFMSFLLSRHGRA